ncbi:MAG: hypothetical protein U0792_20120 [Gemmataceae bacterium]
MASTLTPDSSVIPSPILAENEPTPTPENRVTTWMYIRTLTGIILPMVGVVVAGYLFWGNGLSWLDLGLMVAMYLVSMLGVTIGYAC